MVSGRQLFLGGVRCTNGATPSIVVVIQPAIRGPVPDIVMIAHFIVGTVTETRHILCDLQPVVSILLAAVPQRIIFIQYQHSFPLTTGDCLGLNTIQRMPGGLAIFLCCFLRGVIYAVIPHSAVLKKNRVIGDRRYFLYWIGLIWTAHFQNIIAIVAPIIKQNR